MKKLLAGIVSLALAASMSIPAFAANSATNDGTAGTEITVTGTYKEAEAPAEVVSIDLVWDAMDFTYTTPSKGDWNANTHKYENASAGGWAATTGTDPKITVTNHSNVGVMTTFAFQSEIEGLNGSFTKDTLTLATAEGTAVAAAPNGETAFSVSGSAISEDQKLGTITVTVAKASN